jgi:hypothetical protein
MRHCLDTVSVGLLLTGVLGCGLKDASITGKRCDPDNACPNGYACVSSFGGQSACVESPCRSSSGCVAGYVCSEGACLALCNNDGDCPESHACEKGLCNSSAAPRLTAVLGNGSMSCSQATAGRCFADGLIVNGENLLGAEFKLTGAATFSLPRSPAGEQTALRVTLDLPADLGAGQYTLVAYNSAGSDQTAVNILQGEPGSYTAGLGITISGGTVAADFGSGAGQVAAGDAVADLQARLAQALEAQSFSRLRVDHNAAMSTKVVDISADMITLFDANHSPLVVTGLACSVDCAANGLNGLDTGTLASGSWYYFYAIATASGTKGCIASANAAAPSSMPAGYSYKKLVSTIRYVNLLMPPYFRFEYIHQIDKQVGILMPSNFLFVADSANAVLVDLSGSVPPNALRMEFQPVSQTANDMAYSIAWDAAQSENRIFCVGKAVAAGADSVTAAMSPLWYTLNPATPQTIYVCGTASAERGRAYPAGYELDI